MDSEGETVPYQATVYSVMIASPSDVAAERSAVRNVIAEWNAVHSRSRSAVLLPVGWETHSSPEMGGHPQDILNEQILEHSDLLVGVFWTRLGTPTTEHPSGSVEEIEKHVQSEKPAMLYFSSQPVRPDSVDAEQYEALKRFRNHCRERGLFEEYENLVEFREKLSRQIQIKLNQHPYFQRSEITSEEILDLAATSRQRLTLSDAAQRLLRAAAAGDGIVKRHRFIGGTSVEGGSVNFVERGDARTVALWESAVEELERNELTEDRAGKGEWYYLTHRGFEVADELPKLE